MGELPAPACAPPLATVIAGTLVRDPAERITIAQARRLLAGGTAVSGVPAAGDGTGGAVAGPATHPGNLAYQGNQTRPGGQWYPDSGAGARPVRRRRTAVIVGVSVAVAVVAVPVIIAMTLLAGSPSGSGTSGGSATDSASAVADSSGGSQAAGVPAAFLGHWTGTLTDNTGIEGPQPADLTLASGAVNSVVGTVNYPNVACRYNLRLISSAANQVELYEEIQSGPCISEYVTLTRSGSGITESVYQSPPGGGQQPEFEGRLTKS
jgi:hypothetical protein